MPREPPTHHLHMYTRSGYTDLIVDISTVLLTWPTHLDRGPIDLKALRACLASSPWMEYEAGRIPAAECFQELFAQLGVAPCDLERTWTHVRTTLHPNTELVAVMRALRPRCRRVIGVLNAAAPDEAAFRTIAEADWDALFDTVYVSHALGARLASPGFFRRVCDSERAATGGGDSFDPSNAVFVGHDGDALLVARAFGMHGVLLTGDSVRARRELMNLFGDPVERGMAFLRANAGKLASEVDGSDTSVVDNFSQLLILEETRDR